MRRKHAEDRYAETMRRTNTISLMAAGGISLLTLASRWGHWTDMALIVGVQAFLMAANSWITIVLLKRLRPIVCETIRSFLNAIVGAALYHVIAWPLPVWLWLPFVALAYEQIDTRAGLRALVVICVVQSGLALYDGVAWQYPVVFTALAAFCWRMSRIRFDVIRQMLVTSDEQRTELERAHRQSKQMNERLAAEMDARAQVELELRQAQKLEAIGRLAAGVAHEINTPVQFAADNVQFVASGTRDLLALVGRYQALGAQLGDGTVAVADAAAHARRAERDIDLPYLADNLPDAVAASLEGLGRIAVIVRAMREFAHPGQDAMCAVDLNQALVNTLTVAKHEYKYVAELMTELGELPPIVCNVGHVNQAVLNVVINAAHAIELVVAGSGEKGRITVATKLVGDFVTITISDTGGGIPNSIRDRICEPFFTTKEIGKGTGQGLAIARTVLERHGGSLTFSSQAGLGATFVLRLPVGQSQSTSSRAA
jgi:signal transduction histidine kinase